MQKISRANLKKIYPERAKQKKVKTVFYLHNGKLIEKLRWSYYLLLLLLMPFMMVFQLLAVIYEEILEIKPEDFNRTTRTDNISESHIETLLKGE